MPTGRTPMVERAVGAQATQYLRDPGSLIGSLVMPRVSIPVEIDEIGNYTGKFFDFDIRDSLGSADSNDPAKFRVAPGAEFPPVHTYDVGGTTFDFTKRGWMLPIPEEWSRIGSIDVKAQRLAHQISRAQIIHENLVQDIVDASGNYATGLKTTVSDGSRWDDTNVDVIDDVLTAQQAVVQASGKTPNVLWCGPQVYRTLKSGAAGNLVGGGETMRRVFTDDELADMLNVDLVVQAAAVTSSANEGQTFSGARVWTTTSAGLLYIDPRIVAAWRSRQPGAQDVAQRMMPAMPETQASMTAFGYTFVPDSMPEVEVAQDYEFSKDTWNMRFRMFTEPKQVSTRLGYHWTTVVG